LTFTTDKRHLHLFSRMIDMRDQAASFPDHASTTYAKHLLSFSPTTWKMILHRHWMIVVRWNHKINRGEG